MNNPGDKEFSHGIEAHKSEARNGHGPHDFQSWPQSYSPQGDCAGGDLLAVRQENISLKRQLRRVAGAGANSVTTAADSQANSQSESLDSISCSDGRALAKENACVRRQLSECRQRLPSQRPSPLSGRCVDVDQAAEIFGSDIDTAARMLKQIPAELGTGGKLVYRTSDIESFLSQRVIGRSGQRFL